MLFPGNAFCIYYSIFANLKRQINKRTIMSYMKSLMVAVVLSVAVMWNASGIYAQTVSVKIGDGDEKEKKEEPKEKPADKPAEKSSPSLEYELKRIFGAKSETSMEGPRVENLGKYFLDKHTGQVTLITYHRGEPIRWNILRDSVPDDFVYDKDAVNYQLIRYGDNSDQIILLNVNSGAMWAIDTKGFSYKNTRLIYIPAIDAMW